MTTETIEIRPVEAMAPPGSTEAVKLGCTCPRMDNRHGLGAYTDRDTGQPVYWLTSDCPVHCPQESTP